MTFDFLASVKKHAFHKNIKNTTLIPFFLISSMIHDKMKTELHCPTRPNSLLKTSVSG